MVKFKCLCCDHEQEFASAEAAYTDGWDVAPYFSCQPLCSLCPAAPVVLKGLSHARQRHADAHAKWQREGRPKEYDLASEMRLDGKEPVSEEELQAQVWAMLEGAGKAKQ